jgi:predicted ATP-dependent protease
VVEAVRMGQFSVFAVNNIDEAIELLTGMDAGVSNENGEYPSNTMNGKVMSRLTQLTKLKQELGNGEKDES